MKCLKLITNEIYLFLVSNLVSKGKLFELDEAQKNYLEIWYNSPTSFKMIIILTMYKITMLMHE